MSGDLAGRMAAAEAENARLREALAGVLAVPETCPRCTRMHACAAEALRRSRVRLRRLPADVAEEEPAR